MMTADRLQQYAKEYCGGNNPPHMIKAIYQTRIRVEAQTNPRASQLNNQPAPRLFATVAKSEVNERMMGHYQSKRRSALDVAVFGPKNQKFPAFMKVTRTTTHL